MTRAAEAGFPGAGRLFSLTPAEIEWELTAFAARQWRNLCAAGWFSSDRTVAEYARNIWKIR